MIANTYNALIWNRIYKSTANEGVGDVLCASKFLNRYSSTGPVRSSTAFFFSSKPALTEGLEIDQYIWAILNTLNSSNTEEVTIDTEANWKAVNTTGIKVMIIFLHWLQAQGEDS